MQWEEQIEDNFEEIDQDSNSKEFKEVQLEGYKDFGRPDPKIDQCYAQAQSDIYVMGIDITSGVKDQKDEKGRTIYKPMIKIYAVNQQGNSVLIHVRDFIPYFYVPFPKGLVNQEKNLDDFRMAINKYYKQVMETKHKKEYLDKALVQQAIIKLEVVNRISIRGYIPKENEDKFQYLKVSTCSPNVVSPLRTLFENQARILNVTLPRQTYESNIPYVLRFMVDKSLSGMSWLYINAKQYTLRRSQESRCQLEIECSEQQIHCLKSENEYAAIAPIRILSFDIECSAQHGFPSADRDPIIQIACVCKTVASTIEDEYRVVFVLNGCSSISGVEIKETDQQAEMLLDFEKLIISYDPDFIIGYNIINFDLPYILDRATKLKIRNYGHFGRPTNSISRIKKGTLKSKVMGNRQICDINIEGRIQLDLLIHMQREHKLSSYSLNNVSYHFLRDQKEDVHHSQIFKLFNLSRDARKRLAIYCLKDAELPLKLMEKLCCLYNYAQMARVTGVPINYLLNRGQQIKVVSQLLRKAQDKNFILPTIRSKGSDQKGFEGAYVLDPVVKFYKEPIATLDFASLYPSIMMAHNLCYTTLVNASEMEGLGLTPDDVTKTPLDYYFVTNKEKRQGLLPEILIELITARKKAKKQLATTTSQMMRNVLEGRQLALKISANSVYGFTGATVGQLPCLEISSSVTAFGREMINRTKDKVQSLYPGSQVIYGDTDSVMVKFKLVKSEGMERSDKILQAMELGRQAALQISNQFKAPIKLQFEKVYCPYLLMAKKRYVGVYYSSSHLNYDKIEKKGFESVRRDNCFLIREMLQNIIDLLLCKNNIVGIAEYVKFMISQLVQNKIDISKLVITKAISKNTEQEEQDKNDGKNTGKSGKNTYKNKQPHVELAHKMQKRDENITLGIGDRISYVMIEGQKGSKNYQNAEDPIKVLDDDLPINYDYYINKQIRPPLERLLQKTNIFPNLEALFAGDHTKNRYIPKINKNTVMGKYIKVQSTCTNCPARSDKPLCERCSTKALQILVAKQLQLEMMKSEYQDLWGECIKCQGSVTMDILCQNTDCPIYYRRIKVKNDLVSKRAQLDKLNTIACDF